MAVHPNSERVPVGIFVFFVGFIVQTVFGIILIVKAFRESIGWGLATIFIPFAGLVFVIRNWEDTKKPFLGGVCGGLIMLGGMWSFVMSPQVQEMVRQAEQRETARDSSPTANRPDFSEAPGSYAASMTAPPHDPAPAYVPYRSSSSTPAAATPPPATQAPSDEWTKKPVHEQVSVDRTTGLFYSDKCRTKPENTYRLARTVALMQGLTEAKCP